MGDPPAFPRCEPSPTRLAPRLTQQWEDLWNSSTATTVRWHILADGYLCKVADGEEGRQVIAAL